TRQRAVLLREMKQNVGKGEQRHEQANGCVAPVLADEDLAPDEAGEKYCKGAIADKGNPRRWDKSDGCAPREPQHKQERERRTHDWQSPGPVRDGSQNESRDNSGKIAED